MVVRVPYEIDVGRLIQGLNPAKDFFGAYQQVESGKLVLMGHELIQAIPRLCLSPSYEPGPLLHEK